MLKRYYFIFFLIIFTLPGHVSFSQQLAEGILDEGYYVVVGAYSPNQENYANQFKNRLLEDGYEADYAFSPFKKLLFVFVYYDRDFRASLEEMRHMRTKVGFEDTWVYVMENYQSPAPPVTTEKIDVRPLQVEKNQISGDTSNISEKPTVEKSPESEALKKLEEKVIYQEELKDKIKGDTTLGGFLMFFNLFNASNYNDVSGEVQVIDAARASLLDVVEGGNYVNLPDPNTKTGELLLVCDVFGYRKAQKTINYYEPLKDTTDQDIQVLADIFIVNFDLVRYRIGDIVTMFNVYFFKDAAIMQPKSMYELNQLLQMMKENPQYKIKIHGHTNGNSPGTIIYPGEDGNIFALTDDDDQRFGTAKRLSKERASTIKEYLVREGIEPERMEIKAWGGRRMLYDKHSSQADKNVRVEIEIMEE